MTLKQIAQELGLSLNTVSDVLNGGDTRYSEKTRKRIQETAKRLGYRANRQAQVLAGVKSGLIGFIKAISFHQASAERALYAGEAVHKSGFKVLSYDILWHCGGLEGAVQTMLDARVEGVLLLDSPSSSPEMEPIQRLQKSGVPLVSLNSVLHPDIPHVTADCHQGGWLLADHLLSLGYRKIAMIVPESGPDSTRSIIGRIEGCRERLAQEGKKSCQLEVIHSIRAGGDDLIAASAYQPAHQAAQQLLKRKNRPEALICSNDHYAIGALRACREAGVDVPKDIALVGFDNTAVGSYVYPALTSVTTSTRAVAEAGVDLLLRAVRKEHLPCTSIIQPCTLVVRESCGSTIRRPGAARLVPVEN